MADLTQERLKELLHYDPETGIWTWLKLHSGVRSTIAGARTKAGRLEICVDRKRFLSYRLAFLYMLGRWPDDEVDHKDRDCTNDRWDNLREATRPQNGANRRIGKNNTSGAKGVYWIRRLSKWMVQITVLGRTTTLGTYDDFDEACTVRKRAAEQFFKEYAGELH